VKTHTVEAILHAFEALRGGKGNPDDPLQVHIVRLFDEAGAKGLIAPELVEAVLGRELTVEEEELVLLHEPAEGHG
jgi:hypothetical protein